MDGGGAGWARGKPPKNPYALGEEQLLRNRHVHVPEENLATETPKRPTIHGLPEPDNQPRYSEVERTGPGWTKTKSWDKEQRDVWIYEDPVAKKRNQESYHRRLEKEARKKKEREEEEAMSDGEMSVMWDIDVRDCGKAASAQKRCTKSQRRTLKQYGVVGISKSEQDERDYFHLERLGVRKNGKIVPGKELAYDMWLAFEKEHIHAEKAEDRPIMPRACYMDVFRAPIGVEKEVTVLEFRDGVFYITWDEVEKEMEYVTDWMNTQRHPGDLDIGSPMDLWETFPGDVVEVRKAPGEKFYRGIVKECFKRARVLDVVLVEYGNEVMRYGAEQARPLRRDTLQNRRLRRFCACFFKPLEKVSPQTEALIKEKFETGCFDVRVKVVRYEGRYCIGHIWMEDGPRRFARWTEV